MTDVSYEFIKQAGRTLNSGQSRSLVLSGNVYDLFYSETDKAYVPLVDYLCAQWAVANRIVVVYEINGPIRFVNPTDQQKVRDAWLKVRTGYDAGDLAIRRMFASGKAPSADTLYEKDFDKHMLNAIGNPSIALELLRQFCLCSRSEVNGKPALRENLIILIEAADIMVPAGDVTHTAEADRFRIGVCYDWFSDPGFMNGNDSVVLITESRSLINERIMRLPQVLETTVPPPDAARRKHFIYWFRDQGAFTEETNPVPDPDVLAERTAGLSLLALMQLMRGAAHEGRPLTQLEVVTQVEDYIKAQLGDDIVEFKKPEHHIDDLVGFSLLKTFLREELIPRFTAGKDEALPGAAVCGPIGGGKTFIFEAFASELDMVVLVLKNIRSQWFGQTDVLFERLRRTLEALSKVVIFVDEADTQFGGLGGETHSTERRLTGKIQAMMSDPRLRGKVVWLLMTARIERLSPDIRRPGRVGDLIIPVLDPEGDDRLEFVNWMTKSALGRALEGDEPDRVLAAMNSHSAASFSSLRSELKAQVSLRNGQLSLDDILAIVSDRIEPGIADARRYQTIQAVLNCTRKSLLPEIYHDPAERTRLASELAALERNLGY